MGKSRLSINPIPTLTLTLPLKGREARAPIIAHYIWRSARQSPGNPRFSCARFPLRLRVFASKVFDVGCCKRRQFPAISRARNSAVKCHIFRRANSRSSRFV